MSFVLTDLRPRCLHFSPLSRGSYSKMHVNRTSANRSGTPKRSNPLPWFLGASEYTLILEDVFQAFCDTFLRLIKVGQNILLLFRQRVVHHHPRWVDGYLDLAHFDKDSIQGEALLEDIGPYRIEHIRPQNQRQEG